MLKQSSIEPVPNSSALPDPLLMNSGQRVSNAFEWCTIRRGEILKAYQDHIYGQILPRPEAVRYEVICQRDDALDGLAIMQVVRIHLAQEGREHYLDMLIYRPKQISHPVPAFLGLCFKGLQVTAREPAIPETGLAHPQHEEWSHLRGYHEERWNFKNVIERGYASCCISYNDIFPDHHNGWQKSVYALFFDPVDPLKLHEKYSAIGAWSWGLSRALDCLEHIPEIDATRVAVHGHTRLAKAALWAGACDERFKLVIANDSGCGGAALFRKIRREHIEELIEAVPYWVIKSFPKHLQHCPELCFDQHFLIALIAPRPVGIASSRFNLWSDPAGEFGSAQLASPVYQLFGVRGLPIETLPPDDEFVTGEISYHLKPGKPEVSLRDWEHYLEVADKYL